MSDSVNPFESPETIAVPEKPLISQGNLTENMLVYLKGASPWLRFIGILGFIGSAVTALWGIIVMLFVPSINQFWYQIPGTEGFNASFGAMFGGTVGILCIIGGVVFFIPSLFIYRFGERTSSYLRSGVDRDLELALKNNKALWKYLGILCIIEIAFIPLMIIGGIIIAVVTVFT